MPFTGREILNRLWNQFNAEEKHRPTEERQVALIEEAKRDWQAAKNYFNSVTEPDLIDHAIYAMEAAEKRYIYLLRRAREEKFFQEKFSICPDRRP